MEKWETRQSRLTKKGQIKIGEMRRFLILSATSYSAYNAYNRYVRSPLDFASRYGANSWVLITGGSQGIGYEFARAFAERKFNIILVSKDPSCLQHSADQLYSDFGVSVLALNADFSENPKETCKFIAKKTEDLDVAILINNVGT
jgi:hypothetical protein